jgi:hypothetical protein
MDQSRVTPPPRAAAVAAALLTGAGSSSHHGRDPGAVPKVAKVKGLEKFPSAHQGEASALLAPDGTP